MKNHLRPLLSSFLPLLRLEAHLPLVRIAEPSVHFRHLSATEAFGSLQVSQPPVAVQVAQLVLSQVGLQVLPDRVYPVRHVVHLVAKSLWALAQAVHPPTVVQVQYGAHAISQTPVFLFLL